MTASLRNVYTVGLYVQMMVGQIDNICQGANIDKRSISSAVLSRLYAIRLRFIFDIISYNNSMDVINVDPENKKCKKRILLRKCETLRKRLEKGLMTNISLHY